MLRGADAIPCVDAHGRVPLPGGSRWVLRAMLLAAVGAAYLNAFTASFQFDDWDVIVRDPRVQSLSAWWDSMPGIRPLLKLSYALNHASGLGVVGFHAVNVTIHALGALLALELALELVPARIGPGAAGQITATAEELDGRSTPAPSSTWIAFVAALVFALHPVQTEAVTYASGRSTSLSTALALASLLVWVRGQGRRRQAVSIGLMGLALAVKESAIAVPALIALWVASEPGRPAPGRAALRACGPNALALLIALGAGLLLPAYRGLAETSVATRSPLANLVAQTDALAYLAGQLVRFDRLDADPALEAVTRMDPGRALVAGAIGVLLVGAVASLRRRPLAAFAVLWTFVWLAPTHSLVARLDLVNDRQLYGALLGPALLLAQAGDALIRRVTARHLPARGSASGSATGSTRPSARGLVAGRALVVAVLAAGLGLATHRRNEVYRDELVFWQDVTRKSPGNARAFNNLGFARAERCELDAATTAWRRALALDPALVRAAVNLRLVEEGAGQAARCRDEAAGAAPSESPVSRPPRSPRP